MEELCKRVVTGLCLAPIIALLFYFLQGVWLFLLLMIVALLGVYELATMVKAKPKYLLIILTFLSSVPLYFKYIGLYPPALLFVALIYIFIRILTGERKHENANRHIFLGITVFLFGGLFVMLPLFYIARLKELNSTLPLILLLSIWSSDTCAYFIGKNLGKRPLAPRISPKKTVEGLFGAIIGSMVIIVLSSRWTGMSIWESLIIGCLIGFFGQLGDILESIGKRLTETKDSSALIPAHGGVLDRIDSFIFTAPFLYHYMAGI